MPTVAHTPAWLALAAHARSETASISDLFAADAQRAADFSAGASGIHLDYSKQRLSRKTRDLLFAVARQQKLVEWTGRLFNGEAVNHTEGRAAYHMALRAPRGAIMKIKGENVVPAVHEVLDHMGAFAAKLRAEKRITDVVNIGIGGSDLGPRMICEALGHLADGPRTHFVANVDGAQLHRVLSALKPATTLFIITSKTFTTQETMANAQAARNWLVQSLGEKAIPQHFAAVSTNLDEAGKFGIAPENVFGFWDWVGGRYSLWSAVGLSILVAQGEARFRELLAGAHAMDEHFRSAPLESSLPVLMGLLGVWNTSFLGCADHVLAPYDQRLEKFVSWLQQLEMESNGKSVTRSGEHVDYSTTPALWGDVGTNSQHAFFQMLHQGSAVHPVDFILVKQPDHPYSELHRLLLVNGLAQSKALMQGKTAEQVRAELTAKGMKGAELESAIPHRVFKGNRPSSTLVLPKLDPHHLGALCALYEHRAFVQSVLWDVNPFDQWGVELGKQLANDILSGKGTLDASTQGLMSKLSL